MRRPASLRRTMGMALAGYATLIGLSVGALGILLHEQAEHTVWRAVLGWAAQRLEQREDGTGALRILRGEGEDLPEPFGALPPGLHDHLEYEGKVFVALVLDEGGARRVALLDVSAFERDERQSLVLVSTAALFSAAALAMAGFLAGRRVARPFERIALDVQGIDPEARAAHVSIPRAPREALAIARAVERLFARVQEAIARERTFAETVSHELRTPLSAMQCTIERLLASASLDEASRLRIERLARSVGAMRETVEMLLILARTPERIAGLSEPMDLAATVEELIEEHAPLLAGRPLRLVLAASARPLIRASPALLRTAIGNLLRNAIEHGGEGEVELRIDPPARVRIADPGPGFDLDAIAARWRERVRSRAAGAVGIGLPLTRRLVEHLGWRLRSWPREGGGTVVEIDFSPPPGS